jgi:hypothetical protein
VTPDLGGITKSRRRFYDGGPKEGPTDPSADVVIQLDRVSPPPGKPNDEKFALLRRIAYDDRHCGEIVVGPGVGRFDTDLTSVPALLTWLVPKTGSHLPAALIHDGLYTSAGNKTYVTSNGKLITRVEADRVFRDGMADTGTGLVRRWLVWTAVTLVTLLTGDRTAPSALERLYYRLIVIVTVAAVLVGGYWATADVFDRADRWKAAVQVPWIPNDALVVEMFFGFVGAVVIGGGLGLLWGRYWRAGMIAGVGLALLIHVSLGVLAVSGLYQIAERLAGLLGTKVFNALLVMSVAACAAVFAITCATI